MRSPPRGMPGKQLLGLKAKVPATRISGRGVHSAPAQSLPDSSACPSQLWAPHHPSTALSLEYPFFAFCELVVTPDILLPFPVPWPLFFSAGRPHGPAAPPSLIFLLGSCNWGGLFVWLQLEVPQDYSHFCTGSFSWRCWGPMWSVGSCGFKFHFCRPSTH